MAVKEIKIAPDSPWIMGQEYHFVFADVGKGLAAADINTLRSKINVDPRLWVSGAYTEKIVRPWAGDKYRIHVYAKSLQYGSLTVGIMATVVVASLVTYFFLKPTLEAIYKIVEPGAKVVGAITEPVGIGGFKVAPVALLGIAGALALGAWGIGKLK